LLYERCKSPELLAPSGRFPRGFKWDRLQSIAGFPQTISCVSAKNAVLRTFAKRSGHHIVAVFKETASGAKNDRKERKKVTALALSTASGKLMHTIMAGLAQFERDLIRDRVKSGLAAARARGVVLGWQVGQRPSKIRRPSAS
jgi:Resolvase, N terminal domain